MDDSNIIAFDTSTASAVHEAIEMARDESRSAANPAARRYVVGEHDEISTIEQRGMLGARGVRPPQANVIGQAVREIAGRLQFRRFILAGQRETSGESPDAANRALIAFLETWTTKNRLGKRITKWSGQAVTDGVTAAMVSWDAARRVPVIHDEPWWDGESGMFVRMDATGETAWAFKDWHDGQRERRTLYLPGRILRFQREGAGWVLLNDASVTRRNNESRTLGVPVAILTNTENQYTPYGQSDVADVLGLQDELNGVLLDLNMASMFTGTQLLTATGVNVDDDQVDVAPGTMLRSRSDVARFGAIPAGDIEQLLAHKHEVVADIAAQFPVPSYRIGAGDFPAGIALQRADGPMIAKVRHLGNLFAPGIVLLAHRATEMMNVYANAGLDEDVMLSVEWEAPDQVDPGTQVEIDRERADLFAAIERLTPTMIRKTRVLSDDEVKQLLKERETNRLQVERAINAGMIDPAFEDEEQEKA